ncbi:MAG: PTS IIA-like nitrogen regulatory protein PtsN [Hyphomicrobiales bacterium]
MGMDLSDLVAPEGVIASLKATSKKQALQMLAGKAAELTGQAERDIFSTLLERERLGSTGVGHGVAIPHGKLPGLDRVVGLFARTNNPLDYEALDDQPVDLLFVLLAPESSGADHLKALARIARVLRDEVMAEKIRSTDHASGIYSVLTGGEQEDAA